MKGYQILSILVLVLVTAAAAGDNMGKVPLTTRSDEARQAFLKGREFSEKLQAQESLKYFQMAVEADPDFAIAHIYMALSQPSAKGFFQSLAHAKTSMTNVSEGEQLWIKGFDAGVNGFPLKQREYYSKLVEMYPNDERALTLLGNHYFGQQMFKEAIEQYEKAISINPGFSQPYNQLGYAQRFLENYDEAEKAFVKYIELIPDDPNPYDSYAELLMKTGKYEKSIENYRKALDVNPNFVASHIGIATNLNFLGKHEKARMQLQKLFDMARNDGERRAALFAMTVSYVDEGKYDQALESMKKQYAYAEKIDDTAAMAGDLGAMGNILFETGQYDQAMEKYEKAHRIMQASNHTDEVKANNHRFYLYNSARVALMKNDLSIAKVRAAEFRQAVEAVNNRLQMQLVHEVEGMIAMQEKDYRQAIEQFEQANQQNPYTFYRLAKASMADGDNAKARKYCEKASRHNTLNSMNYAFIRTRSQQMLASM